MVGRGRRVGNGGIAGGEGGFWTGGGNGTIAREIFLLLSRAKECFKLSVRFLSSSFVLNCR